MTRPISSATMSRFVSLPEVPNADSMTEGDAERGRIRYSPADSGELWREEAWWSGYIEDRTLSGPVGNPENTDNGDVA